MSDHLRGHRINSFLYGAEISTDLLIIRGIPDTASKFCIRPHRVCCLPRDLKPENILFKSFHDKSEVKLVDFGFSRWALDDNPMMTQVGSPWCESYKKRVIAAPIKK